MNRSCKNIIVQKNINSSRTMFDHGFSERTDLEQYFWTVDTVQRLILSLSHIINYNKSSEIENCCCLTTPSLGHGLHEQGYEEPVLDLDIRFAYLPKYRYYDILCPDMYEKPFKILVMDPPFFYIPMEQLLVAVKILLRNDMNGKLMVGFLIREEKTLLSTFKEFSLKRTNFKLEYATVKDNKWKNYALYSNIDLPGIKRMKG